MKTLIRILFSLSLMLIGALAQAELYFGARGNFGVMEAASMGVKENYTELELLADYKVSQSFSLQGSVFSRFSGSKTYWGGQVVAPLKAFLPGSFLSSYIAPGYRYMDGGYSAPVLEGGLNMYLLWNFGVGYRFIFNEWVKNGLLTESQFFATVYF